MGPSISKNVANVTLEAISDVSSNIVSETYNNSGQEIRMSLVANNGDIVYSGNTLNQTAILNTAQVLQAIATQKAQQDVASEVSQNAQSLVKGLNLGGVAIATNILNLSLESSINVSSNIQSYCQAQIGQNMDITFATQNGNIYVTDNTFNQMASSFTNCVTNALNDQSSFQQLTASVAQSATATVVGFDLGSIIIAIVVGIIIILILFVCIPLYIVKSTASGIMNNIMLVLSIIIIIVGIALVLYYYYSSNIQLSNTEFSIGLDKAGCQPSGSYTPPGNPYKNVQDAAAACNKDEECQGYDWKTPDGTTTFYSTIDNTSCDLNPDPQPLANPVVYAQAFYSPPDNPSPTLDSTGKAGDLFVNTTTGDYWLKPNDQA